MSKTRKFLVLFMLSSAFICLLGGDPLAAALCAMNSVTVALA